MPFGLAAAAGLIWRSPVKIKLARSSVKNCFLPSISVALSFAVFAAGQAKKTVSWSGVIVYSSCNADEAFAESPECFKYSPGANIALYYDTNRAM